MKEATCRDCNIVFQYKPRPGRPPVKCDPCKNPPIEVDVPEENGVESQERIDWGGPHGLGTTKNPITFKKGDEVRVSGDLGVYKIYRDEVNKDGSYTLYGGSKDPGGIRGFRAYMPSRLSYDKRKKLR